jgi:hypothetical protein
LIERNSRIGVVILGLCSIREHIAAAGRAAARAVSQSVFFEIAHGGSRAEPLTLAQMFTPSTYRAPKTPTSPTVIDCWWPNDLGIPSTSATLDLCRYAYFPQRRRLAVEQQGAVTLYDMGDHQFRGMLQQERDGSGLSFASQRSRVRLSELKAV